MTDIFSLARRATTSSGARNSSRTVRALNKAGSQPLRRPAHAIKAISAGTGLLFVLAGCAVGPDYVTPATQFAPFHSHIVSASPQTPHPAPSLDVWWTGFSDPMLTTVVQRALAQNLDLAAAFGRVQQARAAASGAGANLLPTVDLDATGSAERQSLQSPYGTLAKTFPGYSRDQKEYNVGPAASWEIDLAGGLRRSASAAREEVQAAEADQLGTRITVAADAADAYIQIRGLQVRLAVAQDQIATDAHLLDLVKVRRRLGAAEDRETAQAEALYKQARATVPPLKASLEAQLNRLDVLMGVQPGTYAKELAQPSVIPEIPSIVDSDQPLDVLRRRPDIIAAERRLAASNDRIGAAISDYYPKISLSGALGFDSVSTNHLLSAQSFQPLGTGALRWRLFDFGKVDAEVAQARGVNVEALAQYRQAALKATEDVEDAFTNLSQAEARRVELQDEVTALERSRTLSERAYKAGAITLTDVLDADRLLLVARDDLDGTKTDSARAAVAAYRALGGGWDVSSARKVAAAAANHKTVN